MYSRVYVEITNICNMRCSFCHGHSRPLRRMSQEEFSRILDALEGKTQYVYYHLMGEPLTHPELPRFVRMASDRGFHSVITTNGTLLPQRGEELIAAGVYKVSVSLHSFEEGDAQSYARYLGGVCDFAEAASAAGVIVVLRLWNRGCDGGRNDEIFAFLRRRFSGEWAKNTRGMRGYDRSDLISLSEEDVAVFLLLNGADGAGKITRNTVKLACILSDKHKDSFISFVFPLYFSTTFPLSQYPFLLKGCTFSLYFLLSPLFF